MKLLFVMLSAGSLMCAQETITITNRFDKPVSFKVFIKIAYYKKNVNEQVSRDQTKIQTEKFVDHILDVPSGYSIQIPKSKIQAPTYILKDHEKNPLENYVHQVDIRLLNNIPAHTILKDIDEYEIVAGEIPKMREVAPQRKRRFLCFNVLCRCLKTHKEEGS